MPIIQHPLHLVHFCPVFFDIPFIYAMAATMAWPGAPVSGDDAIMITQMITGEHVHGNNVGIGGQGWLSCREKERKCTISIFQGGKPVPAYTIEFVRTDDIERFLPNGTWCRVKTDLDEEFVTCTDK